MEIIDNLTNKICRLASAGTKVIITNNRSNPVILNLQVSGLGTTITKYILPGNVQYICEIIDDMVKELQEENALKMIKGDPLEDM